MKKETADHIQEMDVEKQKELVAFLAKVMDAESFCEALETVSDTLTPDGLAVFEEMLSRWPNDADEEKASLDMDADRLHEAICEGRKQDAIDILNDIIPSANLRPVSTQNSLFPNRVIE